MLIQNVWYVYANSGWITTIGDYFRFNNSVSTAVNFVFIVDIRI